MDNCEILRAACKQNKVKHKNHAILSTCDCRHQTFFKWFFFVWS